MAPALTPFVATTRQTRKRKRLLAAMTSIAMLGLLVLVSPASPATADEGDYLAFATSPTSTTAGSSLGDMTVQVFDGSDALATASVAEVTLTIASGPVGATLTGGDGVPVADGEVTFSGLSIDKAGTYTLLATDTSDQDFPAASATSGSFDISAADPDHLAFDVQPSDTRAGAEMSVVKLGIYDEFGNLTDSTGTTVSLDTTGGSPALFPEQPATATSGNGVAEFAGLEFHLVGTGYTLDAASEGLTGATSTAFAIQPGDIDHFIVDAPESTIAGEAFDVTVTAYDAFGNLKTDYDGAVTFTSSDAAPHAALLPAEYAFQEGDSGEHTFTSGVTLYNTTIQSVTVTDTVKATASGSDNVTVNPGPIHHFTLDAPASTVAGDPFSVTVTAYDAYDNVKTDYTGTVSFTSSDGSPFPATLPGPSAFNAGDNGVHTFTGFKLYNTTSQTVTVTDSLVSTATGVDTVAVTPGPIHHFTLDAPPSTIAGDPFAVTVTAFDAYNNVKTDHTGTVSFTSSDGSPFPATLPGSYTFDSGDNGVHVFTGLKLYNTTSQTVTVTDSVVSSATGTDTVAVTPAALDHFVWGSITGVKPAGSAFGVSVTAYDAYDNIKTNYTGGATLSGLADSPNGGHPVYGALSWPTGTGVGSAMVTPTRATITDSVSGVAAQTAKVTITDALVTADSNGFAVSPLPVATLTFTGQPIDTQLNTPIYSACAPATTTPCATVGAATPSSPVAVYAVDTFGNPVLARPIAITGGNNSPASVTATTSDGTATFGDDLKRNTTTTGSGVTLLATATGAGVTKTSGNFRVVTTLKGCQGQSCVNKSLGNTSSKTFVNSYSQITTSGSFFNPGTGTNVLQSTQFEVTSKTSKCGTSGSTITWISDAVDQRVTGSNTDVTAGGLTLIVIPKNTLKSSGVLSRGTPSFNVCFGAIWIGTGSPPAPWRAKTSASNNALTNAVAVADSTVVPQGQRYFGIPADCGAAGLPASSPCIYLRTKKKSDVLAAMGSDAASIMTDSDVGIIVKVTGAWDGRSQPF